MEYHYILYIIYHYIILYTCTIILILKNAIKFFKKQETI